MSNRQKFKLGLLEALADRGILPDDVVDYVEKQAAAGTAGIIGATTLPIVGGGYILTSTAGKLLRGLVEVPSSLGSAAARLPEVVGITPDPKEIKDEFQAHDLAEAYQEATSKLQAKIRLLRRKREQEEKDRLEREKRRLEGAQRLYERTAAGV